MASGAKKTVVRRPKKLPAFDPNPSARFAYDLLTDAQVPFALIGRVAMWALLPDETAEWTKDVDFAIPARHRATVDATLSRRGIKTKPLSIGGIAVRLNDICVDFIDRSEGQLNTLFEAAISDANKGKWRADAGGVQLPVVSPEYLVAMKVAAAERKDQRDAVQLLKHLPEIDLHKTRAILLQYGGPVAGNLLDTLAREAGHAQARPEYRNGG